jgi:ComF family protein
MSRTRTRTKGNGALARRAALALGLSLGLLDCAACGGRVETLERPFCTACAARLPWWRRADGCPRCGLPDDPARPGSEAAWGEGRRDAPACPACLAEGSALHRCLAATRYAEPIPGLVLGFKNPHGPFGPRPAVWRAVEYLADDLAGRVAAELGRPPDRVVPIPLHPRRLRRRGFNAADLIARRIAWRLERPFDPTLLERIRDTGSQAGRAAPERRRNVHGAFRARRTLPPGHAPILLIDDVLTTGSTLEAAGEALLAGGAAEVWALTLSATVAGPRRRPGSALQTRVDQRPCAEGALDAAP